MTTDTVTVPYIKTCHKKKFLKLSRRDGLTGSPQGLVYNSVDHEPLV